MTSSSLSSSYSSSLLLVLTVGAGQVVRLEILLEASGENMYFHAVKSTAHPPIIGALGHSTVFIAKQPNTATIKIDYSLKFFSSCEDF